MAWQLMATPRLLKQLPSPQLCSHAAAASGAASLSLAVHLEIWQLHLPHLAIGQQALPWACSTPTAHVGVVRLNSLQHSPHLAVRQGAGIGVCVAARQLGCGAAQRCQRRCVPGVLPVLNGCRRLPAQPQLQQSRDGDSSGRRARFVREPSIEGAAPALRKCPIGIRTAGDALPSKKLFTQCVQEASPHDGVAGNGRPGGEGGRLLAGSRRRRRRFRRFLLLLGRRVRVHHVAGALHRQASIVG